LGDSFDGLFSNFNDNDAALEWCEERILEHTRHMRAIDYRAKVAEYELFRAFSAADLAVVEPLLQLKKYQSGQKIIEAGDAATEIFFLAKGRVSVMLSGEETRRLATFSPGMSFGEMALLDGAPRSADIVADSEVECHLLTAKDFAFLGEKHPAIKIKMLEKLCLDLTGKIRKANRELSVFE
jgi:glutaminase